MLPQRFGPLKAAQATERTCTYYHGCSPHQRLGAAEVREEVAELLIDQRVSPRGMKTAVGPPIHRALGGPAVAGAPGPLIPPGEQSFGHEREAGTFHLLDLVLRERDVLAVKAAEDEDAIVFLDNGDWRGRGQVSS